MWPVATPLDGVDGGHLETWEFGVITVIGVLSVLTEWAEMLNFLPRAGRHAQRPAQSPTPSMAKGRVTGAWQGVRETRAWASPMWKRRVNSQLLGFRSWTAEVGSCLGEPPTQPWCSLGPHSQGDTTLEPYTSALAVSLPLPLPVRGKAAWGHPGQRGPAWPLCPWLTKPTPYAGPFGVS